MKLTQHQLNWLSNSHEVFSCYNAFRCVLDMGADVNEHCDHIFCEASRLGYTNVVELLLKRTRVDPSVNNNSAIRRARRTGQSGVVGLLLKDKRVNYFLSRKSRKKMVSLLIENGIEPPNLAV